MPLKCPGYEQKWDRKGPGGTGWDRGAGSPFSGALEDTWSGLWVQLVTDAGLSVLPTAGKPSCSSVWTCAPSPFESLGTCYSDARSCSHRCWGSSSAPESQSLGLKHQALGCGLPQAARGDASLGHHRHVLSWPTAAVAARAGSQASAGRIRVLPAPGSHSSPGVPGCLIGAGENCGPRPSLEGCCSSAQEGLSGTGIHTPKPEARCLVVRTDHVPPRPPPVWEMPPILPASCKQHHHGHAHPRGRVGSWSSTPHPTVPWQAAWGSLTFVSLSSLLASQPHPRVTPKDMK